MSISEIQVGDKIEIKFKRKDRPKHAYVSRFHKNLGSNRLIVYTPISYEQFIRFPLKDKYQFYFYHDNTVTSAEGSILGYYSEDDFDFTIIKLSTEFERVQRREYYRLPCYLPLKYTLAKEETVEDSNEKFKQNGVILDIGGGGIRFVANDDLSLRESIECVIVMNQRLINVEGIIIDKKDISGIQCHYVYQYRVSFRNVKKEIQDQVVNYVYEQQLNLIMKTKNS